MFDQWDGDAMILLGQEAPAVEGWAALLSGPWLLFLILPILFYLMVLGPEKKKRTEHAAMLNSLKKNDVVLTAGGIYGTVVNTSEGSEDITLRIDDSSNTRMKVLRSAVARVVKSESKDE